MVTAFLRDQDKVLLLGQIFPMGYVQESLILTVENVTLPLGPREGVPARGTWAGSAVFGHHFSLGSCILPSSGPPETDAGDRVDFLG